MQLSELAAGVYDRLGVPDSDPQFPKDVVSRAINSALRYIAALHDWPWLADTETLSTVAGQTYVTPASTAWTGTAALVLVSGTNVYPLVSTTRDMLDEQFGLDTGQPSHYAEHAGRLELRPVPDGVYSLTHRFQKAESLPRSDTDVPLLPDPYADAACDYATWVCLRRSKEDQRAVTAKASFDGWRQAIDDNRRRSRRPGRVRVRRGGWLG